MPNIKPGLKTTELWLVIIINVLPELGAIDVGGSKVKAWLHAVTVVGYAISRGLAKLNTPIDPAAPATTAFRTTGPDAEVPGGGFPPA
jgi:hypothetical protein